MNKRLRIVKGVFVVYIFVSFLGKAAAMDQKKILRLDSVLVVFLLCWSEIASECPVLSNPTDGTVSITGITDGSTAAYSCNFGFNLVGASNVQCIVSTWSNPAPICQSVECTELVANPDSSMVCPSRLYMDSCSFSCNEGYYMTGSFTLTCLATGVWDFQPPTCTIVDCQPLLAPQDGSVSYQSTTFTSQAHFSCNVGFSLFGDGTRVCLHTGDWNSTNPFCLADICTPPPSPTTGVVSCTSHLVDGTCSFSCDDGYELSGIAVITCLTDGSWDLPFPTCTATATTTVTTATTTAAATTTTAAVTSPCASQWTSPSTFSLQGIHGLSTELSYSLISQTTASSVITCVRMCSGQAEQNCGLGDECSLVIFDFINGDCFTFFTDVVNGIVMGCTGALSCFGTGY